MVSCVNEKNLNPFIAMQDEMGIIVVLGESYEKKNFKRKKYKSKCSFKCCSNCVIYSTSNA